MDEAALRRHFMDERLVSGEKFSLAVETAAVERELLSRSTPDSFSLYVSVPFCPTRCAYCSFVSHSVEQAAKLIPDYVDRLCGELAATGEIARELGLRLRTVYFGGGTPTTLTADQLSRVMDAVAAHFDVASAWEYTVEAGRPDTVTEDKLRAIKAGGGRRVQHQPADPLGRGARGDRPPPHVGAVLRGVRTRAEGGFRLHQRRPDRGAPDRHARGLSRECRRGARPRARRTSRCTR